MARPRHRRDDDSVPLAAHARRPRLQQAETRAEIQRPPPPAALALVIARAAPLAVRTAITLPGARVDRYHQRPVGLELHLLDHHSAQSEQRLPYPFGAHAATVLSHRFLLSEAGTVRRAACAPPNPRSGGPAAPTSLPQSADQRRCQATQTRCKPLQRLAQLASHRGAA